MAITAGTKTPLTLSASLAMGALEEVASSTSRMILARVVFSPTAVASILKYPVRLMVPPVTLSPACFSAGMLSPVMADSSMEAYPSTILPSTGTVSPSRTASTSPVCTSSTGISVSCPSLTRTAVLGARSISFVMASDVLAFALASINFPRVISVRIMPEDSKYRSMEK